MRQLVLVVGFLLPELVGYEARAQEAESEREKIRAGWAELAKRDERRQSYHVRRNQTRVAPNNKREVQRTLSEICLDESQNYRLAKKIEGEAGQTLVYARNPHYAFLVSREEGKEWRLLKIETRLEKGRTIDQIALLEDNRAGFYPLSTSCWGTSLVDLIADKNFVIQPLEPALGGKVKLHFRYRHLFMPGNKWLPFSGHVILDPAHHYVAERWEYVMDEDSPKRPCTYSLEFEPEGDHLRCLLTRSVDPFKDRTFTFEKYDTGPIDHAPFRLAYYDLPEPVGVPPPPSRFPRYGWFLLAGAGLLALGVFGRWYWGRRAAVKPS